MMISKELLSAVTGLSISDHRGGPQMVGKFIFYGTSDDAPHMENIYELAHRCKEWAFKKHYGITSYLADGTGRATAFRHGKCEEKYRNTCKTEPEAIFSVCQWILENKDA